MPHSSLPALLCSLVGICLAASSAFGAAYDAPANYYNSATGTGSTLKTQLRSITSNMTGISYGDARYSAPITDTDPNNSSNILLIYNRASVTGTYSNSPLIWNREHIWPRSHLDVGEPSNSSTGIVSDQFNLRPANPSINSTRSSYEFGLDFTSGGYGLHGDYWYPGDADIGDVARAMFYMATRYSQLSLTDSSPSDTQMGDLSSLLKYHYRDVPDDFERRRNHAIYGLAGNGAPAISNPYAQRNRNPYVDHPEYVWSVFVDQQNDSQLYIGEGPAASGGSVLNVDFGTVLVGASVSLNQNVTLHKSGLDGTYYEVTAQGAAISTLSGRYNAFQILTAGSDSRTFNVGLSASTALAGAKTGSVTIDNLDITTAGGTGRGANDADDTIDLSLTVLDHANPSFLTDTDLDELSFDFGTVTVGEFIPAFEFDLANLESTDGFTAGLELNSILAQGDASQFSTTLEAFGDGEALTAAATRSFQVSLDTSTAGSFSASYLLGFSDVDLPGAQDIGTLSLTVSGIVEEPQGMPGDFNADGSVNGMDFLDWQRGDSPVPYSTDDLTAWQTNFGAVTAASATSVPEPSALLLGGLALILITLPGTRHR